MTGSCRSLVDPRSLGVLVLAEAQCLAAGAVVDVDVRIVGEGFSTEEGGPMIEVGQGDVGSDPGVFEGHDVLQCAVGRVTGYLPRQQFPTEADPPQQVPHG